MNTVLLSPALRGREDKRKNGVTHFCHYHIACAYLGCTTSNIYRLSSYLEPWLARSWIRTPLPRQCLRFSAEKLLWQQASVPSLSSFFPEDRFHRSEGWCHRRRSWGPTFSHVGGKLTLDPTLGEHLLGTKHVVAPWGMSSIVVKQKNVERLIARCENILSGKTQFQGKEWKLSKVHMQ